MAITFVVSGGLLKAEAAKKGDYVVLASERVHRDVAWMKVVETLAKRHQAEIVYFNEKLSEAKEDLQRLSPRYVAVVEKPEALNREVVMEGHRLSRQIDDDIYADYLWGIVTGYTAEDALEMLGRSAKPFVIKTALNTTGEMSDGKYFSRFAFMNDGAQGPGWWGEKTDAMSKVQNYKTNKWEILNKWVEKYKEIDPDLLITSSHATEENLEMPFSVGNLKAQGGRLYADFIVPEFLEGTTHPRVYYAAGNCLIGNIDNNPESMAVAWLSGMDATSMVGYVVPTWYGRNGWGGLKYWAANAGRLTLAQAVYLNQQDMLHTEYLWNPAILSINYPFMDLPLGEENEFERRFIEATGQKPTKDQHGFVHDRDVVVFYGDPAWEVKLASIQPLGYQVDFKVKGRKCIITITTYASFDGGLMKGGKLKQEHVADIPFAYYFPKRLENPKLSAGQDWECALAEDFILVYNCDFERNNSYTIILDIN